MKNYQNHQVLIIDDNFTLRHLLKIYLKAAGFVILEAENGKAGYDMARIHQPNLIITDYEMPVMDGMETCQALKSNVRTREIPIVLLSSFPFTPEMIKEFNALGVDSYKMKPCDLDELIKLCNELIGRRPQPLEIIETPPVGYL